MKSPDRIERLLYELDEHTSATFDARTLTDVFAALDDSADTRARCRWLAWGTRITQSRIARLTVAALVIVGLSVLAYYGRVSQSETTPSVVVQDTNETLPLPSHAERLQTDRMRAEACFARADLTGLHQLLQTGLKDIQPQIATYLGQIGSRDSIGLLQTLADQWKGPAHRNPYVSAIEAIEVRLSETLTEPNDPNQWTLPTVAPQPVETFSLQGILSGRITDAITGAPVVDAQVELSGPGSAFAKTNEQGVYSIKQIRARGNYRLAITSKAYLGLGRWDERPVVALTQQSRLVRHFQLEPGCAVDVEVLDELGKPVSGVRVAGSWLGADRGHMDMGGGRTDSSGQVTVGAFAPSDIDYRLCARHSDYAPAQVTISLTDPLSIETVQITMERGITVAGYAEYADGVAADGLAVFVQPDWWHSNYMPDSAEVDAQGNFTLQHIVPGNYISNVMFRRPDGGGTSYGLGQVELPLPEGQIMIVRIPQKSPQSTVAIKGTITWTDEQAATSLDISAYSAQTGVSKHESLHGRCDGFELKALEPGLYTIRFSGAEVKEQVLKDVLAPTDKLEVVLEKMSKPRLTGQVVDADKQTAIERFQARVLKVGLLHGSYYIPAANWTQFQAGAFDIEAVGPGIYQVQVMVPGYAPGLSPKINTDENADVRIGLSRGLPVRGHVTDALGEPISGASIIPLSLASGHYGQTLDMFVTQTGAVQSRAGAFVFEHLAPGLESFKITHPDYAQTILRDVMLAQGMEDLNIVLSPGTALEGRVYDAKGHTQENVTLFVQDQRGDSTMGTEAEATRLGIAVTDAQGFYRVDRLPANQICYVVRKDVHKVDGIVQRGCMLMANQTVQLDFGGPTRVQGIIQVKGDPVPNTRVQISGAHSHYSKVFRGYTYTDTYGRFVFRGVPAGRYGIYYTSPGTRTNTMRAAVVELTGANQDLGRLPRVQSVVEVTLQGESEAEDLSAWRVHMQEGTESWGRSAGSVTEPASAHAHYSIEGLLPGTYQVIASNGIISMRKTVEVGSDPVRVRITIPDCTASVSGRLHMDATHTLMLWNDENTVSAHIPRVNSRYAVDTLPPGRYSIGDRLLRDLAPLLDFTVQSGEHKILDIDLRDWIPDLGLLSVTALGSDGRFLTPRGVYLDDQGVKVQPAPNSSEGNILFAAEPGTYVLVAHCDGYALYTETVTLERTRYQGSSFKRNEKMIVLETQ